MRSSYSYASYERSVAKIATQSTGGRRGLILSLEEIRGFYRRSSTTIPSWIDAGRKHYRFELWNGRFLKLNRFENRIRPHELAKYLVRYTPKHAYMSVLSWLFPERVGGRRKANNALPLDGTFLLDLDVKTERFHHHTLTRDGVCEGCLRLAKFNTLRACDVIEENYQDYAIIFSGRKGFHVLIPFDAEDWTHYRVRDPLSTQAAGRYRYAWYLKRRGVWFDFRTSVDPLRVHSVPGSLNGDTGLIVKPIGQRRDLQERSITQILDHANPARFIHPPEYAQVMVTLRSAPG